MDIKTTMKLNNGVEMPIFGLGTWQSTGSSVGKAVIAALKAGYIHIDTAAIYGNELEIGKAIKESGVKREDIFITTKLWNDNHNDPETALNKSLRKLGVDYVDLYLMHWPVEKVRNITWKTMERLYEKGKCRAIGVSNFTVNHLIELLKIAKVVPAINQVEFSMYLYQKNLLEFCEKKGIKLEAYSPLTRAQKLKDPKLMAIAKKYNKTSAQILIRWCIEHGIVVIPKSTKEDRIKENADVFDFRISEEDLAELDSFNEDFRTCWDPNKIQ